VKPIGGSGTVKSTFKQQQDGTILDPFVIHATGTRDAEGKEYVTDLSPTILTSPTVDFSIDQTRQLISLGSAPNEVVQFHFDYVNGVTINTICRGSPATSQDPRTTCPDVLCTRGSPAESG
jgi:hypothetical protein